MSGTHCPKCKKRHTKACIDGGRCVYCGTFLSAVKDGGGVHHIVIVEGEGGVTLCKMTTEEVAKAKKLIVNGLKKEEYPEKLNDLIDKTKINHCGTISTSGDGWGWYNPDGTTL